MEKAKITPKHKAKLMQYAWALAKQGALNFGGKPSDYISESMRIVWLSALDQMKAHNAKIDEMDRMEEYKKTSIKVASWFVDKNFDMKMFYDPDCNKVVKETEKAILLDLSPEDNDTIEVWVPKSCILNN